MTQKSMRKLFSPVVLPADFLMAFSNFASLRPMPKVLFYADLDQKICKGCSLPRKPTIN